MRDIGARRVEGSGDNMKIYAGEGDDSTVLNLAKQEDLDIFANLYRGVEGFTEGVGPRDVATSAYQQGAPVDLKELWEDIYGKSIPFPEVWATDEFGQIQYNQLGQKIPDISKYNEVIDALEARVGSLSRYGLDRDADYQLIDLGDQYESDIVISDGKVTKINKTTGAESAAYTPGIREDISAQMPGYDVIQQPTGQLSTVQQRVDPGYIIDPQTMQPYFQQPDGSLQAAPTPSVDDQISMHLVEGNMDAAVSKANFRDRPTSLEYFNAAMEWARTPADIFTISAIVRGVLEPTPGPMGELRRVGAPPAWATQAWVGLQNSMGIPVENMTSGPGAEPGSVNEMMVASSSGLVPNSFASANSAPTTLDGGRTITQAASTITPSTRVTATTASGQPVHTTAGLAYREGLNFEGDNNLSSEFLQAVPTTTTTPTTTETLTEHEALLQLGEENPNILDTNSEEFNLDAFNAAFYEGSFNQKIDDILATGATVKPGGGFIHQDGREWDANGSPIVKTSDGSNEIELEQNQTTAITEDALRQVYIDAGRNPDTGLPYEYGDIDSDDMFVESEADRVARIGTGATLPTTSTVETAYDIDAPIDIGAEGGFETLGEVADESWMFGSAGGDDYYVPPGAYSSGVTDEVEPTEVIIGYTEPGYGRNADGDWVVLEPSEPIYGPRPPSESEIFFSRLEEAQEAQEVPEFFPASSLSERWDERRELPFEDATKVGPANLSTPTATPMPVPHTWGVGMGSGSARAIPAYDPEPEPEPEPEPVYEPVYTYEEFEEDEGSGYQYIQEPEPEPISSYTGASEEAYWDDYDEGAEGIRTGDRFTLVGEEGPELALFPRGTEIVPLNRPAKPKQRKRLRSQFSDAIDSFAFGGFSDGGTALVGEMGPELVDLPPGAQVMPAGITEMMTGRPTRAPRSLFRQAGMRAPSAQTIANLLPEEIEVYQEMGRLAGIPEKAFEREFRSMVPMGQGGTRQARFTPRGTGRTRYGSI